MSISRKGLALVSAASFAGYVALGQRHGPGPREARAFWRINSQHAPVLRVPQQLGTPWVLPLTAVVALATGRPRLGIAASLALPVEKAIEVRTKKLFDRPRPAQVWSGVAMRDDAPADGPSYPSGHSAISATAMLLSGRQLPVPVAMGLAAAVAANALARVQQGAHHPLDTAGGVLLGVGVATGLEALFGRDEVRS